MEPASPRAPRLAQDSGSGDRATPPSASKYACLISGGRSCLPRRGLRTTPFGLSKASSNVRNCLIPSAIASIRRNSGPSDKSDNSTCFSTSSFRISCSEAKARSMQSSQHSQADSTRRSRRRITSSLATFVSRSLGTTLMLTKGRLTVTVAPDRRLLACRRASPATRCRRAVRSLMSNLNGIGPVLMAQIIPQVVGHAMEQRLTAILMCVTFTALFIVVNVT